MVIVNFSHPITPEQRKSVEGITGKPVTDIIDVPNQIDPNESLWAQVAKMVEAVPREIWDAGDVIVNLPSLNYSAAALMAILYALTGSFPSFIQMARNSDVVPPRFDVVRVVSFKDLQQEVGQTSRLSYTN